MQILTVNLSTAQLKAIAALTGPDSPYPSRCELIRMAVRDWLIAALNTEKTWNEEKNIPKKEVKIKRVKAVKVPAKRTYGTREPMIIVKRKTHKITQTQHTSLSSLPLEVQKLIQQRKTG